ncbi:unnamed protein product, partial [Polarella glacialis]
VLAVDAVSRELLVSDWSTRPVRVGAREPLPPFALTAEWLFAHIAPGQWLKLRDVSLWGEEPEVPDLQDSGEASQASDAPGARGSAAANAALDDDDDPPLLRVHAAK